MFLQYGSNVFVFVARFVAIGLRMGKSRCFLYFSKFVKNRFYQLGAQILFSTNKIESFFFYRYWFLYGIGSEEECSTTITAQNVDLLEKQLADAKVALGEKVRFDAESRW